MAKGMPSRWKNQKTGVFYLPVGRQGGEPVYSFRLSYRKKPLSIFSTEIGGRLSSRLGFGRTFRDFWRIKKDIIK
jgi:hypothetical protein